MLGVFFFREYIASWAHFILSVHLFHELLPLYEKQYLKSYFLGIALWCYITAGRNDCGQKCVFKLLYTIFYFFFFFGIHQIWEGWGVGLIGHPSKEKKKKERGYLRLWPKRLHSQATNSQNSVSTRPTQARSRPDPQLTALFHAVLCCAIPGQEWLKWLSVHFYLLESSLSAKRLCKKWTEQTNKCSSHLCLLFVRVWVLLGDGACVLPV